LRIAAAVGGAWEGVGRWAVVAGGQILKGLSGCKVTKPGVYMSAGGKKAVRCSQKAEDGYLFPLEKSFFYITKPATVRSEHARSMEFSP